MNLNKEYKLNELTDKSKSILKNRFEAFLKYQSEFQFNDMTLIEDYPIKIKYKGNVVFLDEAKINHRKILFPKIVTAKEEDEKYEKQLEILDNKVEYFDKVSNLMKKEIDRDLFRYVLKETLTERQLSDLGRDGQVDYSINLKESNFRLNFSLYSEGGKTKLFLSIRKINKKPFTIKEMGINSEMLKHFKIGAGLILISGPTGSAKSSTLNAILDYYNKNENKKIITLEDPIEFFWEKETWDKSIILQREVGKNVESFKDGLKAALRANPDIVVVGELRDQESVEMAIETAGTGHLVIATVHVKSTYEVLDRILGFFEGDKTKEIASKLSGTLNYVLNQRLISTKEGYKVAYEYLDTQKGGIPGLIKNVNLKDVKEKMREKDDEQESPHRTLSEHLYEFIVNGLISEKEVIEHYINEPVESFENNFEEYISRFAFQNELDKNEIKMKIEEENIVYEELKKIS